MTNPVTFLKERFGRPSGPAPTVLVVDDEGAIRRFVDRVLREAGYHVIVADRGAAAQALARGMDHIDLLLTDLMMPGMSGDELARRLRAKTPDLPVLYLTAYCDRLFAERMLLWEREAFLEKPCSVNGLREAVSLALAGTAETVDQ
jgi:two-component system cell cycle sensor histidine kinase/response regulator CckA